MDVRNHLAEARRRRRGQVHGRGPSRLPGLLEHLLFAVTLGAVAYLCVVGPLLANAA